MRDTVRGCLGGLADPLDAELPSSLEAVGGVVESLGPDVAVAALLHRVHRIVENLLGAA
ncbi:hypothetical protein ACIBG0_14585 [Nocardia sp. NPDC050630]|uniref:hypothetical protein n=1 Tax=Nocardia sp. NPDC050630 TaxID=3364321 RepID=UPI0037B23D1E